MFKAELIAALSLSALFSLGATAFSQAGNAADGAVETGSSQDASSVHSETVLQQPAATSDGFDSHSEKSAPDPFQASTNAFFKGDYSLAKTHCLNCAKAKPGKTAVLTPDDFASSTTDLDMAKEARLSINLGLCDLGLKEPEKARRWFEHAQKLLDKIKEPSPLDAADCLTGLGECHYMQGQTKLSLRDYSEAISFYKQKLGRWHPDSIPALEGLAGSHYIQGDYKTALPLYEQIARIDLAAIRTRTSASWIFIEQRGRALLYVERLHVFAGALRTSDLDFQKIQYRTSSCQIKSRVQRN